MDTAMLPFPLIHPQTAGLTAIYGGCLKPVSRGHKNSRSGQPLASVWDKLEPSSKAPCGSCSTLSIFQASTALCPVALPLLRSRCTSWELPGKYTFHRQLSISESVSRESHVRLSPRGRRHSPWPTGVLKKARTSGTPVHVQSRLTCHRPAADPYCPRPRHKILP